MTPKKVFLSYSTKVAAHQQWVINLHNKLRAHGVDATLDVFDLKPGQDMYAFMETILRGHDKVVILSDCSYQQRADARAGGVGAEAQVLTSFVYNDVQQQKVIPVFVEWDETNQPSLPIFLKSRYALDFTDPEQIKQNYAKLYLTIMGQTLHQRSALGTAPDLDAMRKSALKPPTVSKKEKNTLDGSELSDIDDVHIGDKGSIEGEDYDRKNHVKDSTIRGVKTFRLGDDVD